MCGEAEDLPTALARLAEQAPDLVLLDLSLGHAGGLDALKQLRGQRSDLRVLVITTHDERVYGERVIRAGALGDVIRGELAVSA